MTEPRTAAPDIKTRLARKVMEEMVVRDYYGSRLHWSWGEADAEGFHTPTLTVDANDNVASEARAAVIAEIRERVEELHHPVTEWDYVSVPPREVTVCVECLVNDEFHQEWPCRTAAILDELAP